MITKKKCLTIFFKDVIKEIKNLFYGLVVLGLVIISIFWTFNMNIIDELHNKLIFYPSKEFYSSPEVDGIPYEEVFIKTPDKQTLHGYFFPAVIDGIKPVSCNKVVLYLHGNGQNVSTWYMAAAELQANIPVNILLVDYRGYGKSTGFPSINGVNIDAHSMYQYLVQRGFNPENISIYGRSIGGAIGLELAGRERIKSIVVQSSFSSLKDIAKEVYPILPDFLIKNNSWNSIETIKILKCPVLISHGDKDDMIPVHHAYKLYDAANEPKKLVILNSADHNDLSSCFTSEYFNALKELFL